MWERIQRGYNVAQLTSYLRQNRNDLIAFGVIGAGVYLFSKNVMPNDMSVLQSSIGGGLLNNVVTLEIQTLLLFIVLGIALGIIVSVFVRKR